MSEWHRNEWFIKNHYVLRFTASAFLCPSPIRRRKLRSFGVTKMKRERSFFSPNFLSSFPRLRLTSTRKVARPKCWRKYPRSSKVEQWSTLVKIDNPYQYSNFSRKNCHHLMPKNFCPAESQREHLTVWGNMDEAITSKCYKINPNIPVFFR